MLSLTRVAAIILTLLGALPAFAADVDWSEVEAALGREASMLPGDVHRFGMPRGDLGVTLGDVTIRPALALGAWAAFYPVGDGEAMVMGDLVLTDAEVAPVMKVLGEGGVAVTALHNHLVGESPKIMYVHMGGRGDPVAMARTIKAAIDLTGTPEPAASAAPEPATVGFDIEAVQDTLGREGSVSGGVLHIGVPRAETLTIDGIPIPPSMGTGTAINFQPTGSGGAVAYGDFAVTGDEVASAISTLRETGIETMALHNHMLDEEPRLFYIHFWGEDDALALARGLEAALLQTNVAGALQARITFDDVPAGTLPSGWKVEATNPRGPLATWVVQKDARAASKPNVLALTDTKESTGGTFNLIWTDRMTFKDGVIEVKVRAGTGREDQGGGPIWRVRDKDNYYVARWNPLEDNFRLYFVKDGRRIQLDSARVKADHETWHTIRIEQKGDEITGSLDGEELLEVRDRTFAKAGGVGVWTKADAASFFDDLVIRSAE